MEARLLEGLEAKRYFHEKDIKAYVKMMEEMAGAPKEELGKRQPGEKCMYEQFNINGEKN